MQIQNKTRLKSAICLLLLNILLTPVFAQTVKKPEPVQKNTTVKPAVKKSTATTAKVVKPAVKKPATTANVVKPATTKTPAATTTASVAKPVKTPPAKELNIADLKMTDREKQMVDEINLVRSDPAGYVKYVTEYVKKAGVSKPEKAAGKELVEVLKSMQPLNSLAISPKLYVAAREFGKELLETNTIQHSNLPYAENLSFGIENIREAIIYLLIDHEEENRGHRKNILKKNISLVAVHEIPGKVEDFDFCYIQEFK
jgi:uncharacterized protein YkwD